MSVHIFSFFFFFILNFFKANKLRNNDIMTQICVLGPNEGWYKKKRDKIGMRYESLHITELLSVQCLQVADVIPILLPC